MEPNDDPPQDPPAGEGAGAPDSDEDYGEEEAMLDADNPMLDRIQQALTKQLQNNLTNARVDLANKAEELKQARKEREDLGVELYQVQQALAKQQLHLEKTHEKHSAISRVREKAERELAQARAEHGASLQDVKAFRSKYDKHKLELDRLSMTLVEVEKHADEVKGEIAVTRRATYKVEEDITKAEAGKKAQDLLIDRLNEELSGLHDKYARYEAQLAAQRRETGAAGNTLGDAAREMEQIQFEKKQLLGQWRSALLGMQRRDEALQATLGAIRRQQEQGAALEAELRAITKAQAKAEEAHEALTQRQRRVLADKAEGERVIAQNTEKHKKLNEKFAMCKRALDATDAELSKAQAARQTASDEIAAVEAKVQKVAREAAKLDGQRLNALSEQTALDKASHNLKAAIERKQAQIGEKEMAAAALENDLARIKVDALNTTASNVLLRQRLEQLNAELRDKDALVARYEQEAKRRNDEIGKKELGVTQLSRRLDAMKEKAGLDAAKAQAAEEEAAGPLEATIRELRDEIERKAAESAEMQRQWIGGQTELVGVENDNATRSEAILEMRSRLTVLEQKRARLDGQLSAQNRELLELGRGMEGMHHQMTKMNMLIAKQRGLRESLANETHALEAGFVHRLREMEAECLKTEAQVGALAAEKERLLTDVAESERELLLWEKKIALERETQAAIDPEVGSGETKAMLKEIHRMKLRFSTLKKREEEMLAEMEKAIYKRDNIEAKGRTAALKAPGETQAALRKSVADLSKRVTLTAHDAGAAHEDVTRMRQRQADLAAELEALDAQRREMLAQEEALHAAIQTQEIERAFHETETHKNGRLIEALRQALAGTGPREAEADLREQLRAAEDEVSRAAEIASTLAHAFPAVEPQLKAILLPATLGSSIPAS